MSGGPSIQDVTKRVVAVRLPLGLASRIERKFRLPEDRHENAAYVRAPTAEADGVALTKEDYDAIESEITANYKANQRRKIEYAKKHGTRTRAVV